jgi:hypothetical protein
VTSVQYPSMKDEWSRTYTAPNLTYGFDSVGRPYSLTDVGAGQAVIQSAGYGPANELTNVAAGSTGRGRS